MQEPAIRCACKMGLETIVLDGDRQAPFAPLASQFFPIDIKDKEAVLELAQKLYASDGLAAVFTAGTDFSSTVAYVSEKLNLPGNSYKTALNTTDKTRMRTCLAAAAVPSPRFLRFTGGPLHQPPFDFPVVVKPADSMGARGCSLAKDLPELKTAVEEAARFSQSGAVIIEEFMDGPEFSIDSVVYNKKIYISGFALRHIYFPPYFIEMGHTMPDYTLTKKQKQILFNVFKQAVKALEIKCGCAKGDVKFTSKGPMIGEIASRLSGGYMSGWTYPYASGARLTKAAILAALGRPAAQVEKALRVTRNYTSAERAFISIPGVAREVLGVEDAKKTRLVKNVFLRVKPGSTVDFPKNNVSKCGNIISASPFRHRAAAAAESAAKKILLPLEQPNEKTELFLFASGAADFPAGFPPDAFVLTPALREEMLSLPSTRIGASFNAVLTPFASFENSGVRDWQGRTVKEALEAVRGITGMDFFTGTSLRGEAGFALGREFWQALVRGTYQGAVYYLEKTAPFLKNKRKTPPPV